MNRKELRRQWALYKQAEKAWEEANQSGEEVVEAWLKEGGVSRGEYNQMFFNLKNDFVEAIHYRKAPLGLTRFVLLDMLAVSLALPATGKDELAEYAALVGRTLVELALENFE
jgi:hypothetical protein